MLRLLPVLVAALVALAPAGAQAASNQVMSFEAPSELLDDAKRDGALDEIQTLGVNRVRALAYWRSFTVQADSKRAPAFDTADHTAYPPETWGRLDRLIAATDARGMELQLTLTGPVPRWATAAKKDQFTRPSAKLFGRWARAVATRYGGSVDLWSIWNEPNHPDFLRPQRSSGGRAASPALYRDLYVAGERAVHGVRGGNRDVVLFGETAPIGNSNVVSPIDFLRGALCLNSSFKKAKGCKKVRMDGFAHHPYSGGGDPTFRSSESDEVSIGSLDRLTRALDRAARARAIDANRPIYLTEFGVQSRPDPRGVALSRQPEYLAMSEHIAYLNPRVKAFSQYLLSDDDPRSGADRYGGFETGLRHSSGRKKPSYNGFMLPLRVSKVGSSHVLWGRVRPATAAVDVRIERDTGKGFKRLTETRTGTGGVFGLGTRAAKGARYRVKWTRADGASITGPPIRPY